MSRNNKSLHQKVNREFKSLKNGPWFKSGKEGVGPVNYDRGNDADFHDVVDNDFGFFGFEPSAMEMPYKKEKK